MHSLASAQIAWRMNRGAVAGKPRIAGEVGREPVRHARKQKATAQTRSGLKTTSDEA